VSSGSMVESVSKNQCLMRPHSLGLFGERSEDLHSPLTNAGSAGGQSCAHPSAVKGTKGTASVSGGRGREGLVDQSDVAPEERSSVPSRSFGSRRNDSTVPTVKSQRLHGGLSSPVLQERDGKGKKEEQS
jgi:hypothetical protein